MKKEFGHTGKCQLSGLILWIVLFKKEADHCEAVTYNLNVYFMLTRTQKKQIS